MGLITMVVIFVLMMSVTFAIPVPDGDANVEVKPTEGVPCSSDDGVACFYQINDHSRSGAINTKTQTKPYRTYYTVRCSRANKFDIYILAEDQNCNECKEAIDLTALS